MNGPSTPAPRSHAADHPEIDLASLEADPSPWGEGGSGDAPTANARWGGPAGGGEPDPELPGAQEDGGQRKGRLQRRDAEPAAGAVRHLVDPLTGELLSPTHETEAPIILSRAEHPISRRDIDDDALRVLNRLAGSGHHAFLVGGGVRDLALGRKPKDFDIGTDARPSRLKKLFRNCRIIGRRFRIAHIFFPGGKIIEVSTFRKGNPTVTTTEKGKLLVSDNQYGTPQEDALRRDLTINGLFYDIATFSVIDYVGGWRDLQDRVIRTIAPPDFSFQEDPVRMIRVERHAARTGFTIEESTFEAILRNRTEIRKANTARLLEEVLKDLKGAAAAPFFELALRTSLLDELLPPLAEQLRDRGEEHPFWARARSLDRLVEEGRSFTNSLLLSVLLHTVVIGDPELWHGLKNYSTEIWRRFSQRWREVSKTLRVSRRDIERITQILITYRKLNVSLERGRLLGSLQKKPYLSEALDFLEIDLLAAGKPIDVVAEWRLEAPPPPAAEHRYRVVQPDLGDIFTRPEGLVDGEAFEGGGEPVEGEAFGAEALGGDARRGGRPGRRRSRRGGARRRETPAHESGEGLNAAATPPHQADAATEPLPRRRRRSRSRRRGGRGGPGTGGGGSPQ